MWTANIDSKILINATPDAIWAVLIDFEAYPSWNPFIRLIDGHPRKGESLRVEMLNTPKATPMRFSPQVLVADPSQELRWLGRVVLPGLLDAEHSFKLSPEGASHTWFHHSERFSGVLVPLFRSRLVTDTATAFAAMNKAFKVRVEGR